jgi:hypothetical protein
MKVKVVSYYSPRYATHANQLRESCRRWDVDAEIVPVKEFRSWHDGVSAKPTFIARKLDLFSAYDGVMWVDADGYFVRPVPWGDLIGADVAATKFQWTPGHREEVLTGSIFFANNNRVKMLLQDWERETKKHTASDTPEQDALVPLLKSWKHSVMFQPLSIEWTWIDDERVKAQFPKSIPLIIHKQASRQVRAEEFRRAQAKGT